MPSLRAVPYEAMLFGLRCYFAGGALNAAFVGKGDCTLTINCSKISVHSNGNDAKLVDSLAGLRMI